MRIRLLTTADLHQSRLHYRSLVLATKELKPDVVAVVGDALHFGDIGKYQFATAECARMLADLPVRHLVFVRGNHEGSNWTDFVRAWPFENRPLTVLYGTAFAVGPLVMVGFPCMTGPEEYWCDTLPKEGNEIPQDLAQSGRKPLPADTDFWLPKLMKRTGPAGRTVWLMHECPVGLPLAHPAVFNPTWTTAIERFSPLLSVSGHDHETPIENSTWHTRWQETTCVNLGQAEMDFHHCIIDFEFGGSHPALPTRITLRAFPQDRTVEISGHARQGR